MKQGSGLRFAALVFCFKLCHCVPLFYRVSTEKNIFHDATQTNPTQHDKNSSREEETALVCEPRMVRDELLLYRRRERPCIRADCSPRGEVPR